MWAWSVVASLNVQPDSFDARTNAVLILHVVRDGSLFATVPSFFAPYATEHPVENHPRH
jgi:hypothetical protein